MSHNFYIFFLLPSHIFFSHVCKFFISFKQKTWACGRFFFTCIFVTFNYSNLLLIMIEKLQWSSRVGSLYSNFVKSSSWLQSFTFFYKLNRIDLRLSGCFMMSKHHVTMFARWKCQWLLNEVNERNDFFTTLVIIDRLLIISHSNLKIFVASYEKLI